MHRKYKLAPSVKVRKLRIPWLATMISLESRVPFYELSN
jgi:hypothetical protein